MKPYRYFGFIGQEKVQKFVDQFFSTTELLLRQDVLVSKTVSN